MGPGARSYLLIRGVQRRLAMVLNEDLSLIASIPKAQIVTDLCDKLSIGRSGTQQWQAGADRS
jgi:hypothetical protein